MFKRNTAVVGFGIGHFIQTADGAAKTTGTPVCKRLLDGVGGACANAASYNADGAVWEIDLAAADMDGAVVVLSFALADCIPISYTICTVTATGVAVIGEGATLDDLLDELDTAHGDGSWEGSATIDKQDMADALLLAPSAGTAATGSVMAQLAAVRVITDDLDVSAVTQVAASSAGHLTITAGLTFDEEVSGLVIPADWVAAIWTLKHSAEQADSAAVIQLRVENPADPLTDGLLKLNGAAPVSPITAADGALTVDQAGGVIGIWLADELTLLLEKATGLGWDVKFVDDDDDSVGRRGTADVVLTETKAIA